MTNHPLPCSTSPQPTPPQLHDRVAALELFVQQLVLVLECEPNFSAHALARWMELSRARMLETGSAPAPVLAALSQLQRQVLQ